MVLSFINELRFIINAAGSQLAGPSVSVWGVFHTYIKFLHQRLRKFVGASTWSRHRDLSQWSWFNTHDKFPHMLVEFSNLFPFLLFVVTRLFLIFIFEALMRLPGQLFNALRHSSDKFILRQCNSVDASIGLLLRIRIVISLEYMVFRPYGCKNLKEVLYIR